MDTIKTFGSLESLVSEESARKPAANDPLAGEIRTLGDGELVLVGGGDGIPCWP